MNGLKLLVPLVPVVVPIASRWVRSHEAELSQTGFPLTVSQQEDARRAGVQHPEKIRLGFVSTIPMPAGVLLGELARMVGLINPNTVGITLRYGIYIRHDFRENRGLLVHEFVHVGQYERLGSIENFLRPYLRECLDPGYPEGPLEQEAVIQTEKLVGGR